MQSDALKPLAKEWITQIPMARLAEVTDLEVCIVPIMIAMHLITLDTLDMLTVRIESHFQCKVMSKAKV